MSLHQIEDLVEDSIILVHKTQLSRWEKRTLIHNLYNLQYRFDTSSTLFRVISILKENHYLYELPIEQHPDYDKSSGLFSQFNEASNDYIPVDFDNDDKGSVLLKDNKLWFEAGSHFWDTVKTKLPKKDQVLPRAITIPRLFFRLLTIAFEQKENVFIAHIYASFVNSIIVHFDFTEEDQIPNNFNLWLKDKDLLAIRKFFEDHQKIISAKDKIYKDDEYYSLPKLKEEVKLASKPDEKAKVRFLLDAQTTLVEIEKKYKKEQAYVPDIRKYDLIYEFFRTHLTEEWQDGVKNIKAEKGIITFLNKDKYRSKQKDGSNIYKCIILEYRTEIKTLVLKFGIQNETILNWQNRSPSANQNSQHFKDNLFFYCSDDELNNDKNISYYGGWKYDIKKTKKTLLKRLEFMWLYFEKYNRKTNKFYFKPISDWVGIEDSNLIMKKRGKVLKKKINFFGNEIEFKLFLACANQKQGKYDLSNKYINEIEELFNTEQVQEFMNDGGEIGTRFKNKIEQGLTYLKEGKGNYPELTTL